MAYYEWRPYVPVAQRRANAQREVRKLRKKGKTIEPVEIEGRTIARTFWGKAWCRHLEQFSDFENRLPRGRTYVRNGSVCHLGITRGRIEALVSGSELYSIEIRIKPLAATKWKRLRRQCAGHIGSMLELLQGRFSDQVMGVVTDPDHGLFPKPKEISLGCDCLDWAVLCKHVAAVLYAIGARLDQQPELLFVLRGVDHEELISTEFDVRAATTGSGRHRRLAAGALDQVFGIDIDDAPVAAARKQRKTTPKRVTAVKKKIAKPRPFTPTAASVSRLRKRLGLNRTQFAGLLGVSPVTVANWENGSGRLNLRSRTREALIRAAESSAAQAKRRRSGS